MEKVVMTPSRPPKTMLLTRLEPTPPCDSLLCVVRGAATSTEDVSTVLDDASAGAAASPSVLDDASASPSVLTSTTSTTAEGSGGEGSFAWGCEACECGLTTCEWGGRRILADARRVKSGEGKKEKKIATWKDFIPQILQVIPSPLLDVVTEPY